MFCAATPILKPGRQHEPGAEFLRRLIRRESGGDGGSPAQHLWLESGKFDKGQSRCELSTGRR
jgi:hypothetical protein